MVLEVNVRSESDDGREESMRLMFDVTAVGAEDVGSGCLAARRRRRNLGREMGVGAGDSVDAVRP